MGTRQHNPELHLLLYCLDNSGHEKYHKASIPPEHLGGGMQSGISRQWDTFWGGREGLELGGGQQNKWRISPGAGGRGRNSSKC